MFPSFDPVSWARRRLRRVPQAGSPEAAPGPTADYGPARGRPDDPEQVTRQRQWRRNAPFTKPLDGSAPPTERVTASATRPFDPSSRDQPPPTAAIDASSTHPLDPNIPLTEPTPGPESIRTSQAPQEGPRDVVDLLPVSVSSDMVEFSAPLNSGRETDLIYQSLTFARDRDGRVTRKGAGSNGIVVKAFLPSGMPVAVKVFTTADIKGIQREWAVGQADKGPHVVPYYALLTVRLSPLVTAQMLVMRLADGPTLHELMHDPAVTFDGPTQRRLLLQGLSALHAIERQGGTHRDIKPGNMALLENNLDEPHLLILDHGCGKDLGAMSTAWRMGTQAYASPELLLGGYPTVKSDEFSFAASMLDVFTDGQGFTPHPEDPTTSRYARPLIGRPNLDDPRLDPLVRAVLTGALVKRPKWRPSLDTLVAVLNGETTEIGEWDPYTPVLSEHDLHRDPSQTQTPAAPAAQPMHLVFTTGPDPADIGDDQVYCSAAEADTRDGGAETPSPPKPPTAHGDVVDVEMLGFPDPFPADAPRNWFIRFAGADDRRVKQHGTRVAYAAAGQLLVVYAPYLVVGMTAMAVMVAGLSATTLAVGAVVGVMTAIVMVCLDRSIFSSVRSRMDGLEDPTQNADPLGGLPVVSIGVRVLMSLLLALAVSEPVNLLIFHKDVEASIAKRVAAHVDAERETITARYGEAIERQQGIAKTARGRITDLEAAPARFRKLAKDEEEGKGATGKPGCGPQCRKFLRQMDAAEKALPGARAKQQVIIDTANAQIQQIEGQRQAELDRLETTLAADNGFFAREKALFATLFADPLLLTRYLIVTLFLLMFEMAIVIIKLGTHGNNYELDTARRMRLDELKSRLASEGAGEQAQYSAAMLKAITEYRFLGDLEVQWNRDAKHYARAGVELPRPMVTSGSAPE